MARYLISFQNDAMDFPEEEMREVASAARAVQQEARDAGVFVFVGGLDPDVATVSVTTDGMVVDGPYPESKELLGGIAIVDVPTRDAALDWAGKIARACRCAQKVRVFLPKRGQDGQARYLISFDRGDMDFPEEDFPAVGEAAHAVIFAAMDAGVFVFSAGLDYDPSPGQEALQAWVGAVAADGTVVDGPRPESRKPLGGFTVIDVPTHEAALEWAGKFAGACRCAQDVRMFLPDPEMELRAR